MTDRVTLGVQFDPDSELLEQFEEYKENNGFTSRAETMRHLMREELQSDGDRAGEDVSAAASRSTLTAVALYAVVELAAFPAPARYTLFGAAFVFAASGVVGYERILRDIVGEKLEFGGEDDLDDEAAVANMTPIVRVVGGTMILLALGWTAVSGVL